MKNEALVILAEECAEVIQEVAKVQRFGTDKNKERLVKELGDLVAMIAISGAINEIKLGELYLYAGEKCEKLKNFSTINPKVLDYFSQEFSKMSSEEGHVNSKGPEHVDTEA